MSFVRVCALSDLPAIGALSVQIEGEPVAVVRVADGALYAISDVCSHADVALSEGEIDDCSVECWLHGSRFDLRTGEPSGPPAVRSVPVYPVMIEGDGDNADVLVDVAHPINHS
jgi:3-phenylpropionate/trans-cinnamate dioxygenase ferredoxin subunit